MNKKSVLLIVVFCVASFITVLNVNIQSDIIQFSDVSLDNVEALAQESDEPDCVQIKGVCFGKVGEFDRLAFK
jgi:hypothetical protein